MQQTLEGLASILPALLSAPTDETDAKSSNKGEESGDEEEEEEEGDAHSRALMHLFEVSLDLLSLQSEQHQATRGLRDCVKKAWQAVCALHGSSLSVDVIDSIVAAVIGEEQRADDDEDEDEGEGEGSDQEEGDDNSDDEMDVDVPPTASKSAQKGKKTAAASKLKEAKEAEEEKEEEDVLISEEAAFDMLTEGVDGEDDDDHEGGLQHSAEVDSALAQMIALKQQSRKAGVLQALKQSLLVRSRSIDILEVRQLLNIYMQ